MAMPFWTAAVRTQVQVCIFLHGLVAFKKLVLDQHFSKTFISSQVADSSSSTMSYHQLSNAPFSGMPLCHLVFQMDLVSHCIYLFSSLRRHCAIPEQTPTRQNARFKLFTCESLLTQECLGACAVKTASLRTSFTEILKFLEVLNKKAREVSDEGAFTQSAYRSSEGRWD